MNENIKTISDKERKYELINKYIVIQWKEMNS